MATPKVTIDELMTELSHLLGEVSVPTSGVDGRKAFLQRSYEDAWKMYAWPFAMLDTTITFNNGVATLPKNFLPEGHYYLSKADREINETDYASRAEAVGTTYYVRYTGTAYELVLLNDTDFTAEFRYQYEAPDLLAGRQGPYPNKTTLAAGALRFTVKADNPEADNSQEESTFLVKVQEDYSPFNRTKMRNKRARSVMETRSHSTGAF